MYEETIREAGVDPNADTRDMSEEELTQYLHAVVVAYMKVSAAKFGVEREATTKDMIWAAGATKKACDELEDLDWNIDNIAAKTGELREEARSKADVFETGKKAYEVLVVHALWDEQGDDAEQWCANR